jgi:CrcB protein
MFANAVKMVEMTILGIALAGALGTLCRYAMTGWMQRWLGPAFPWGTLSVNLVGCLLLGLLLELARQTGWVPAEFRTIAGVGFLGGFTTFSTFGVETFRAIESGDWMSGGLNILLNVVGGLALVAVGIGAARWLVELRSGL